MTAAQLGIVVILVSAMALFLWGRWRHDVVAMAALLACVLFGLVPAAQAFAGFGHPAVITVACVLVLGYGLQASGVVSVLAKRVLPTDAGPTVSILALIGLAAVLSGFINNVGALALLMPVALQMAEKQQLPAGKFLMPLAFGSILGGMTTLIGTPDRFAISPRDGWGAIFDVRFHRGRGLGGGARRTVRRADRMAHGPYAQRWAGGPI
jgi:di/tricarboxylate transporter